MAAGWTETPNFIYDLMPEMKEAEIKVVMAVVRKTIGWHVERVTLRLTDFIELTGLSKPSVNTGIQAALKRGIINREVEGESFTYWVCQPNAKDVTVKNFNHGVANEDQSKEDESKNSLPSTVKNFNYDQSSNGDVPSESKNSLPSAVNNFDPETVKNLNPNKTNSNTNKPKKGTATQRAPQDKPLTPQQEMYGAICEALGWDYQTLTDDDKVRIAQAVKILGKAEYTVEDIRRFMVEVWFHDWRWEKFHQRPTLTQLRQEIGKLRAITPEQVPRPPPNGTSKVAASLAAIDEYERIKAKHGAST